MINYYYMGAGGPWLLAVTMVPYSYILYTLDSLRKDQLYPKLGKKLNYLIASIYIVLCIIVATYLSTEFYNLRALRLGSYNIYDITVSAIMLVLIMEYARKRHRILFFLNIFLILYAVYGWLIPGIFAHKGLSIIRVITAMGVELETGVFEALPQLALTLVGSFLLVISIARGFGCIESIIKGASTIARKSLHGIPQSAVIGSMGVGTATGSGAANAAAVGSFTIPLMIKLGFPRPVAAGIETSASIGSQIMPPVMGIAAFIMSSFLNVSYFDVMIRGYLPALIYYGGVALSVYLLTNRYVHSKSSVTLPTLEKAKLDLREKMNIFIFIFGLSTLVYLMGVIRMPPILAALTTAVIISILLSLNFAYHLYRTGAKRSKEVKDIVMQVVDHFATQTSDLTLLLSTLGILVGIFTITGVPTKIGAMLMEVGRGEIVALIVITFLFGYFVGLGVPPAATYILVAIVIAPYMVKLGIDPWVIHFYAFFLGVFSELSPPTSVAAAVSSKIAGASFLRTMFEASKICISLYVLMFVVFTRPNIVVEPGISQLFNGGLVMAGTSGIIFGIFGKFDKRLFLDVPLRIFIAILSLLALFHPDINLAVLSSLAILVMIVFGLYRLKRVLRG
ncbi:MAG: TRAP transporter fused permease subunit [Nitrososphaerota archaeon]|nr:TRAP transporter fused permease subunit [Nitrososphaerota archaeon]